VQPPAPEGFGAFSALNFSLKSPTHGGGFLRERFLYFPVRLLLDLDHYFPHSAQQNHYNDAEY